MRASPTDFLARTLSAAGAEVGKEVRVGVRVGPVEFKLYPPLHPLQADARNITFRAIEAEPTNSPLFVDVEPTHGRI